MAKTVRVKRSLWSPMVWRQEYYRLLASRLILWLGGAFAVAFIGAGICNALVPEYAVRFALVTACLLGTLVGSLGVVLMMNRREGREMAKREEKK